MNRIFAILAFFFTFFLASTALAQAICPPYGSPDPWGGYRPAEWIISYTFFFSDGSMALIQRDVCRGDPALSGDPSLLVWWSADVQYCQSNNCQAIVWPTTQTWWLPPPLRIFPRIRAA